MNTNATTSTSRRDFLARTAVATGALIVGFRLRPAQAGTVLLDPRKAVAKDLVESFVALHPDGKVTIHVG